MNDTVKGFLERNLPRFKDDIVFNLTDGNIDHYKVTTRGGKVYVDATNFIAACTGLYRYLQEKCRVQLSWCGNRTIDIEELVMFDGAIEATIKQKYRVYMNYCTLDYTMAWWDFARWEKEIDFMAMNGINMPLAVIGSEAVWYETLVDFGLTKEEALSTLTGNAFYAWHLMTNLDSYFPPQKEAYIYERLELGRKILARYVEFGMYPIMQGFSGHVPMLLKKKYPNNKILPKAGWNGFPKTGQLDPLDPLFEKFGLKYLENMDRLLGNHHFIACDPFHEGFPPKPWSWYLRRVGKAIDNLYRTFDKDSIWVMQGWTPRKHIFKAVPKDRLLILDISSDRHKKFHEFYGYPTIAGMLHNFGGKNPMQGQIRRHTKNAYKVLEHAGCNVVGSGMFMEGVEQNPVVYDLQFHMLTEPNAIDYESWLDDYIDRRYGSSDEALRLTWDILMNTCYKDEGYKENEVGSTIASRPHLAPKMAGPCDYTHIWYDTKELEKALTIFLSVSDKYKENDGYQYDLCDITRQVLSNRFHDVQEEFANAYSRKDITAAKEIAKRQLELILDIDELLSHRSEMTLDRWLYDAHALATDEDEKHYFDKQARTLITLWGDINGMSGMLADYSWREWHGLLKDYYYVRWDMFYKEAIRTLENGEELNYYPSDSYILRKKYRDTPFGRRLNDFELSFACDYKEYAKPVDSDVIPSVKKYVEKYNIK